jgi:hypothetical protein
VRTFFPGTSVNRRLTFTHPSRLASTWPKLLSLAPAGPAVPLNEFHEWIKKTDPAIMQIQAAPGTDEHNYGQLIKLLREKGYVRYPVFPS